MQKYLEINNSETIGNEGSAVQFFCLQMIILVIDL